MGPKRELGIRSLTCPYGPNEWMDDKGTSVGKLGKRTNVDVGKCGASVSTGHKGKPVNLKVPIGKVYGAFVGYGATEDFLLIMSIYGLLFFITIIFLLLAKPLPSLDLRRLARKTMAYHQHSQPVLDTPSGAPLQPSSQSVGLLAQRLYHLVLKGNIAVFVDVTIILMRIVAPVTNPDAKVPITVRLLLSPTLLGHLLVLLLHPLLLLLMSRQ
ncbi:uncharacterized protein LOC130765981 [Actinidia eriantha]|uniref:uncharacterized protein LOC130765981 n=1 Tax=Actinidia eriantha TaxID=165200 RepID=UPI00258794C0|nr:uncharacterized protein LOC130765981 [Actinidia eriantha]